MNLLYVAQFHETCGYSHAAIGYLKSLDSVLKNHPEVNLRILSVSLDPRKLQDSFHRSRTSREVLDLIDKYHFKNQKDFGDFVTKDYTCLWHMTSILPIIVNRPGIAHYHSSLSCSVSNVIKGSLHNYHLLAWETDTIPQEYQRCIELFQPEAVLAPSQWNQKCINKIINSETIPHLVESRRTESENIGFLEKIKDKFVVLAISEWVNRKNFTSLIRSFLIEMSDKDDAFLVLKTNLPPGHTKEMFLKELEQIKATTRTPHQKRQNMFVILDYLSDEKMQGLYENSTIFSLTSYGEGFSLPTSEAVLMSKPVLCPDQGGHIDYIHPSNRYFFEGFWDTVFDNPPYDPDGMWYIPSISSIRQKLNLAYSDWKSDNGEIQKSAALNLATLDSGCFTREKIGNRLLENLRPNPSSETKVSILKRKIANLPLHEKVKILKGSFQSEDCYILSCGPSLKDYDSDRLKSFLKDKLVFTVKQAYNLFKDVSDFHFFNCSNLPSSIEPYAPHYNNSKSTITVSSSNYEQYARWSPMQLSDVFFKVPIRTQINNEFLVRTGKIDDFLIENNLTRPCGPGIMYETVLFMAIHLGVKSITCIGWDLTKQKVNESNYEHFYGSTNGLINRGDILDWEIEETREFSKNFYEWCCQNDIELKLASQRSSLYEKIPRIKLEI